MTPHDWTRFGFLRAACVAPELKIADTVFNAAVIAGELAGLAEAGVSLALFPELCLTGYTCADLFFQEVLLRQSLLALEDVAAAAGKSGVTAVVGLPVRQDGRVYNCAAVLSGGQIAGFVPKTYLPTTGEYYEERWFTSGRHACGQDLAVTVGGARIPFGVDLLFALPGLPDALFGIEVCEDLWAVAPPSGPLAQAGALMILNPSASNELLGKADYRRDLVRGQSARCLAGYLYAGAGPGESSTDMVFSGHCLLAENGVVLAESERFRFDTQRVTADFDLDQLTHERMRNSSFSADSCQAPPCRVVALPGSPARPPLRGAPLRPVSRTPFVPHDTRQRAERCREIFTIQSTALAKRLRHLGGGGVVLGLSGGLDSTLALLVAVGALEMSGGKASDILCVSMPGFGTTQRTQGNAEKLAACFGATLHTVPISECVSRHFQDIGHDPTVHDATYENAQARERTQVLMDMANKHGGIVVGTGDLSEIALGWCTYNGDHMSMYHVNAGVPKTLVRYLIEWCAEELYRGDKSHVLLDVCATPITPELLPLDTDGSQPQETEAIIGPYLLHDFFLYNVLRHQFEPRKVLALAETAFAGVFDAADIGRWLALFYRRFFSQQFKRSAMPDGPKVGSVALSPRADWRMPSDASPEAWLRDLESDA